MHNVEHKIGEVYYQLGIASVVIGGDPLPIVSSWRYDGLKKLNCNSRSCEVPYQYYCFTRVTGQEDALDPERSYQIHIPSRQEARLSMLTWHDFRLNIMEFSDDGSDDDSWVENGNEPDDHGE